MTSLLRQVERACSHHNVQNPWHSQCFLSHTKTHCLTTSSIVKAKRQMLWISSQLMYMRLSALTFSLAVREDLVGPSCHGKMTKHSMRCANSTTPAEPQDDGTKDQNHGCDRIHAQSCNVWDQPSKTVIRITFISYPCISRIKCCIHSLDICPRSSCAQPNSFHPVHHISNCHPSVKIHNNHRATKPSPEAYTSRR